MKFERLKLRFGGRIAVTHARSAVRLRDDEFTELQAHWLSRHLRAAIGMHDGLGLHDSSRRRTATIKSWSEYHTSFSGPRTLLMSHVKSSRGAVATSSRSYSG